MLAGFRRASRPMTGVSTLSRKRYVPEYMTTRTGASFAQFHLARGAARTRHRRERGGSTAAYRSSPTMNAMRGLRDHGRASTKSRRRRVRAMIQEQVCTHCGRPQLVYGSLAGNRSGGRKGLRRDLVRRRRHIRYSAVSRGAPICGGRTAAVPTETLPPTVAMDDDAPPLKPRELFGLDGRRSARYP